MSNLETFIDLLQKCLQIATTGYTLYKAYRKSIRKKKKKRKKK